MGVQAGWTMVDVQRNVVLRCCWARIDDAAVLMTRALMAQSRSRVKRVPAMNSATPPIVALTTGNALGSPTLKTRDSRSSAHCYSFP
jgi:hypothetical protein